MVALLKSWGAAIAAGLGYLAGRKSAKKNAENKELKDALQKQHEIDSNRDNPSFIAKLRARFIHREEPKSD